MVLRPQARLVAQPPKAALSAESSAACGRSKNQVFGVVEHRDHLFTGHLTFVLLCRAGVHARRKLCGITPAWILCCESRSVGAACMRPVGDCLTIPSFDCDGVRSMRRGGIYAARETVRALSVTGSARRVPCLVGRAIYLRPKSRRCAAVGLRNAPAGDFARRTDDFKNNFYNVRRG